MSEQQKQPSADLMEKSVSFIANGEELHLTANMIKKYISAGNEFITNEEIVLFMKTCQHQHLNPFIKDAFLVKYDKTKPAQIITSKDAYMKRAEDHPMYEGFEAGLIIKRGDDVKEVAGAFMLDSDKLLGAWAKVYRKDKRMPIFTSVTLKEYGKSQSTWKSMPGTMLRKVALVQACREAFPNQLGGLHTMEEMQASGAFQSNTENTVETVQATATEVQADAPLVDIVDKEK